MENNSNKIKQVITPYAFPKNESDFTEVGIESMSITYVQPDDTNHGGEYDTQYLTISTETVPCNREDAVNGEAYYFTLQTERWAISDANELKTIIDDFQKRLQMKSCQSDD